MLEIAHLVKRYGEKTAVDDLSLFLPKGQHFALLGPNGAGKTTLLSILVGASKADRGTICFDGRPFGRENDPLKSRIGYVPQELALYEDLSARDNLRFFGSLYGLSGVALEARADEELAAVGLLDVAKNRVRTFSGGMKRRLNIAVALLHRPELLILDEPTVGVDPQSRNAIFDRIEQLGAAGMTLLYTTHYMEEAERLCDRIAIMDNGKIIADGTQADLHALLPVRAARLRVDIVPSSLPLLTKSVQASLLPLTVEETPKKAGVVLIGETLFVTLADLAAGVPAALHVLNQHGIGYTGITTERPHLEEVFLHLTGKSLRD